MSLRVTLSSPTVAWGIILHLRAHDIARVLGTLLASWSDRSGVNKSAEPPSQQQESEQFCAQTQRSIIIAHLIMKHSLVPRWAARAGVAQEVDGQMDRCPSDLTVADRTAVDQP